jgi:hypothetical protein
VRLGRANRGHVGVSTLALGWDRHPYAPPDTWKEP